MIKITIKDGEFIRETKNRIGRYQETHKLMRKIAGIHEDSTETNFEREGRPRWKPLKPSTLRARAKAGHSGKILQRSGRLAASITSRISHNKAVTGTNVIYSRVHQFGYARKNIAKRPFLKLTKTEVKAITSLARSHYV